MNIFFLTVILLTAIGIVVYPQPIIKTIKKAMPILLIFSAVFGVAFYVDSENTGKTVTITASGEANEKSEGSEIWIHEVIVNGESRKPADFFSGGWIAHKGNIIWRNYDMPEDAPNSVSAEFNEGDTVQIVFVANKWRGIARLSSWNGEADVDTYMDTEDENSVLNIDLGMISVQPKTGDISLKLVFVVLCAALIIFSTLYYLIHKKNKKTDYSKRLAGIDFIKIISAVMIILIHECGGIYNNNPLGGRVWMSGLILNALTRFAVPSFVMVSGLLMIGKETSLKKAVKKSLSTVVIVAVWNIFYIMARHLLYQEGDFIKDVWLVLFKRGPSGHLWYGYLLAWIYAFIPVIDILYKKLDSKMKMYFITVALVIPALRDTVSIFLNIDTQRLLVPYNMYISVGYIAIMFAGRMIYENKDRIKIWQGIACAAGGLLVTVLLSYAYSINSGVSKHDFFDELQISNIVYAAGVLAVCLKIRQTNNALSRVLAFLADLSLGVYFAHNVILWLLGTRLAIGGIIFDSEKSVMGCLVIVIICYVITTVLTWCLSNIPYVNKIVKI